MKWTLNLATGERFEGGAETIDKIAQHAGSKEPTLWLDIEGEYAGVDELLENVFGCHPLAIEDCHRRGARPKIQEYPSNLFIIFRGVNYNPGQAETDTINLHYFLGKNYIVTLHHQPLRAIRDTMASFEKSYEELERNPGKILYETLDRLVDNYFPMMDKLDKTITRIEDQIFFDFKNQAVEEIFALKKSIMKLKRSMGPQEDILDSLTSREWHFVREENFYHYRDIANHVDRLSDQLDLYRDLSISLLESFMTQVSNRMNEVMKVLSIVATIMLPLSLLTGIFGMNFVKIPGLEAPGGFWILVAVMVLSSAGMIFFFRLKKWL